MNDLVERWRANVEEAKEGYKIKKEAIESLQRILYWIDGEKFADGSRLDTQKNGAVITIHSVNDCYDQTKLICTITAEDEDCFHLKTFKDDFYNNLTTKQTIDFILNLSRFTCW